MYSQFFLLERAPFSIAPDPRHLFMSERHREALAHLLYGAASSGGIVLLTGEIGAGKTTVARCFLEQVPANCNVAYIFNPRLTAHELLQSICDEFHITVPHNDGSPASLKEYIDALNIYLLAAHAGGRTSVLIIDEAQNLSADVLEQLRLLTNLETNERKLLQIILIGQPELRDMLARPEMEQLAQRVIARYHLSPLSIAETAAYIAHRLTSAGLQTESPFPPVLVKQIHRLTRGVPRRINLLCDRALLGAYASGTTKVTQRILKQAARELFGAPPRRSWTLPRKFAALALATGALIAGTAAWTMTDRRMLNDVQTHLAGAINRVNALRTDTKATAPSASAAVQTTNAPAPALTPTSTLADTNKSAPPAEEIFSDSDGPSSIVPQNENIALHQLAQMWGADLPVDDACAAATQAKLRCYWGTMGFGELRQLDRPVMLTLTDAAGKKRFVILTGLTGTTATLRAGNATQTVNLLVLTRHTNGEFTTFWRIPEGFTAPVRPGDSGNVVDWVAAQLAKLNDEEPPPEGRPFDHTILRQLREFQATQGLKPDGVAGAVTLMHLNRVTGIEEPGLVHSTAPMRVANKGE